MAERSRASDPVGVHEAVAALVRGGLVLETYEGYWTELLARTAALEAARTGLQVHVVFAHESSADDCFRRWQPDLRAHGVDCSFLSEAWPPPPENRTALDAQVVVGSDRAFVNDLAADYLAVDSDEMSAARHDLAIVLDAETVLVERAVVPEQVIRLETGAVVA